MSGRSTHKEVFVLSHALQAKKLRYLIDSGNLSNVYAKRDCTLIVQLRWHGSAQESAEWNLLQTRLGNCELLVINLPLFPNVMTKSNIKFYSSTYNSLFSDFPGLERIFFFSYFHHYSGFAQVAAARGLETTLIEEGLSTFRGLSKKLWPRTPGVLMTMLVDAWQTVWDRTPGFENGFRLTRLDMPDDEFSVLPGGFREFDFVLSRFPHEIVNIFPDTQFIEIPVAPPIGDVPDRRGRESLFVAQTYRMSRKQHRDTLLAAMKVATGRLRILVHPRASRQWYRNFELAIADIDPAGYVVDDGSRTDLERLVREERFEWVFSLTSTALLEVGLWDSNVRTMSLFRRMPLTVLQRFGNSFVKAETDYRILENFSRFSGRNII